MVFQDGKMYQQCADGKYVEVTFEKWRNQALKREEEYERHRQKLTRIMAKER